MDKAEVELLKEMEARLTLLEEIIRYAIPSDKWPIDVTWGRLEPKKADNERTR